MSPAQIRFLSAQTALLVPRDIRAQELSYRKTVLSREDVTVDKNRK